MTQYRTDVYMNLDEENATSACCWHLVKREVWSTDNNKGYFSTNLLCFNSNMEVKLLIKHNSLIHAWNKPVLNNEE